MKKELKEKWIKALRSGRYKQTKETLMDDEEEPGYCCLGVLCKVSRTRTRWAGSVALTDCYTSPYNEYGEQEKTLLNTFGLTEKQHDKLIDMNDNGKSFPEIADWISKNIN